jgi:membrane associated rhomboid family serine protease
MNGIVFGLWILAFNTALLRFMVKYGILQHDYTQNRTNTLSIIGYGFSHRGINHLITNMVELQTVGPLAISAIGKNGFVQLYSCGLVISGITSCI